MMMKYVQLLILLFFTSVMSCSPVFGQNIMNGYDRTVELKVKLRAVNKTFDIIREVDCRDVSKFRWYEAWGRVKLKDIKPFSTGYVDYLLEDRSYIELNIYIQALCGGNYEDVSMATSDPELIKRYFNRYKHLDNIDLPSKYRQYILNPSHGPKPEKGSRILSFSVKEIQSKGQIPRQHAKKTRWLMWTTMGAKESLFYRARLGLVTIEGYSKIKPLVEALKGETQFRLLPNTETAYLPLYDGVFAKNTPGWTYVNKHGRVKGMPRKGTGVNLEFDNGMWHEAIDNADTVHSYIGPARSEESAYILKGDSTKFSGFFEGPFRWLDFQGRKIDLHNYYKANNAVKHPSSSHPRPFSYLYFYIPECKCTIWVDGGSWQLKRLNIGSIYDRHR